MKGTASPSRYPGSSLARSEPSHCFCCLDHMNKRTSPGAAGDDEPEIGVADDASVAAVVALGVAGPPEAGNAVGEGWLPELLSLSVESTRRRTPTPVKIAPIAARSRPARGRRALAIRPIACRNRIPVPVIIA